MRRRLQVSAKGPVAVAGLGSTLCEYRSWSRGADPAPRVRTPGAAGIEGYLVLVESGKAFGQTSYDIGSHRIVCPSHTPGGS